MFSLNCRNVARISCNAICASKEGSLSSCPLSFVRARARVSKFKLTSGHSEGIVRKFFRTLCARASKDFRFFAPPLRVSISRGLRPPEKVSKRETGFEDMRFIFDFTEMGLAHRFLSFASTETRSSFQLDEAHFPNFVRFVSNAQCTVSCMQKGRCSSPLCPARRNFRTEFAVIGCFRKPIRMLLFRATVQV